MRVSNACLEATTCVTWCMLLWQGAMGMGCKRVHAARCSVFSLSDNDDHSLSSLSDGGILVD